MTAPSGLDVPPGQAVAFGDRAAVVGAAGYREALAMAAALEAVPLVVEVVPGMRSVVVQAAEPVSEALLAELAGFAAHPPVSIPPGRDLALPTTFDGEDLEEVAAGLGMDRREVVDLLCSASLTVAFLGFSPGFPYLVGLPEPLEQVGRRASPRPSVPAGSVAVAGGFAGVYPFASPGGWQIVGSTQILLFDPGSPPYATLQRGDRVRLEAVPGRNRAHRPEVPPRRRPALRSPGSAASIEVLAPGTLAMVQGAPRRAVAGIGVPAGGPADRATMTVANRLVGNPDHAGALEIAGAGPALRLHGSGHLALVAVAPGAISWTVDRRQMPPDTVVEVGPGQVIEIGAPDLGMRAYLVAAGGLAGPEVMGSVSSDVLSGLGPGRLLAGDVVGVGPPGRPRGVLRHPTGGGSAGPIRVMPGPHRVDSSVLGALCGCSWTVGTHSSRVGLRLESLGPRVSGGQLASLGMVAGAVQVPPAGAPVILGVDHGTMGGYPAVACVIDADLDRLGQLAPGDRVELDPVDLDQAREAGLERDRRIDDAVSGWFPTLAG